MARSRAGGCRSLLSGKLGDVIFSICRNTDGSFRQQIQSNPVTRENPNTDEQARARITMATIERAMYTFRDFMGTGFEGVPQGTLSVSKFSEVNYNELRPFLNEVWYFDENIEIPWDLPIKGQSVPRDGSFIISQGTLRERRIWYYDWGGLNNPFWRVRSRSIAGDVTLADWLENNGMQIGDQRVFIRFMQGRTPSKSAVVYAIVATDQRANPNTIITQSNFRSLLTLKANVPMSFYWTAANNVLSIEFTSGADYDFKTVGTYGTRCRRVQNGVTLYNNCQLATDYEDPQSELGWNNIRRVRNSWTEPVT